MAATPKRTGRSKSVDVALEAGDDLVTRHEAVGLTVLVLGAGKPEGPVGADQGEGVPSTVSPGTSRCGRLLQHEVLHARPAEVVAGGQTGLASPDDDGIDSHAHECAPVRRLGTYPNDCLPRSASPSGTSFDADCSPARARWAPDPEPWVLLQWKHPHDREPCRRREVGPCALSPPGPSSSHHSRSRRSWPPDALRLPT